MQADTDADTTGATGSTPVARWLRLDAGAATSTGHRRDHNEDAAGVTDRACFVADGMGGHAAGEVAAAIAIEVLLQRCASSSPTDVRSLADAVAAANDAVRAEARRAGTSGMGATIVGAVVVVDGAYGDAEQVAVLHVGDCRCYRLCDGVLHQVTRDHSLVQELVDSGRLDAAAAAAHPMANVVTRAVGPDATVVADIVLLGAAPGRLLLCSDGLSDAVPAGAIARVLAGSPDPQAAARHLVELVLVGAARDNVTAVVVDTVDVASLDVTGRLDSRGAARPSETSAETPARA